MDVHLQALAARQSDVVAAWQLRQAGWTRHKVHHHAHRGGWRRVHPGVYVLISSPLTQPQLWFAAVLTAPGTVLTHGSAGACWGFYRFQRGYEVVTRAGNGGRRRGPRLLVLRSTTLGGNVTRHHGIPITTAPRVLIDLASGLTDKQISRAFREAIRLKCTTAASVRRTLDRHPGRPGTPFLHDLASRYARIPYQRTRSDAEARALELLHDAGRSPPQVNVVVAGEEADLVWFEPRVIVEIDGPQYHRFRDEDARKQGAWERAGFVVRRVPSDAVYDAPGRFLAACPP